MCLTRIRRHVSLSLSLSLSRPVHGLCWYCHVSFVWGRLWIWLLLCGVSFVFGLIFLWPVFMQWIFCNLSDNKKSGVSLLSHFSISSPVRGFYFVFVSLWFPKANFVVKSFVAKLQPSKFKRNLLSLIPCFFRKKIQIVEKCFFWRKTSPHFNTVYKFGAIFVIPKSQEFARFCTTSNFTINHQSMLNLFWDDP
jgi:hypothetical protein